MAAFDLVEFFFEQLGHTFVAARQLSVDLSHQRFGRVAQKPFTQAGAALTRGGGGEDPCRQRVKGGDVKRLGRWRHSRYSKNTLRAAC